MSPAGPISTPPAARSRQRRPRSPLDRRGNGGQAARVAYVHGRASAARAWKRSPRRSARCCRRRAGDLPVSGGSEATETALKLVRAYHVARGEEERKVVIARWGSYHGNSLGALDLSGRRPLRRPYEAWLGRFRHVSAAYPYRAGDPGAHASAARGARRGARAGDRGGRPGDRGAFVAEPIVGRRWGRVTARWLLAGDRRGVPSPWRAARRRRGDDRLRADRPLVRDGPLGDPAGHRPGGQGRHLRLLAVRLRGGRRARVRRRRRGGFVHGFTFSHSIVGAAVAREVLRILREETW